MDEMKAKIIEMLTELSEEISIYLKRYLRLCYLGVSGLNKSEKLFFTHFLP